MYFGEAVQLDKSGQEKLLGALAIGSRIVVECRRHLDQALQERLLRIRGFEPDALPLLVRFKETCRIEGLETLPEKMILFLRIHVVAAKRQLSMLRVGQTGLVSRFFQDLFTEKRATGCRLQTAEVRVFPPDASGGSFGRRR